ncbi:MAG: TrkA family potassium uptake protein [Aigarchaeota archaeon]|nr:TrkA family potassium uptake protein [Aigarchaeota archaeon]
MYIVVVGAGVVGMEVLRHLSEREDKLVVIERSEAKCKEMSQSLDAQVFIGDASNKDILTHAGLEKADLLLATTDEDHVNLAVCKAAKTQFGVPFVVSLVNSHSREEDFVQAGVDVIVCPVDEVKSKFINIVERAGSELLYDSKDLSLARVVVGPNSHAIGKDLNNLGLPSACRAVLARRRGSTIFPGDSDIGELHAGDELFLAGKSESVKSSLVYLKRSAEEV